MLVRFSDEIIINRDTNSPFLGDPMGIMNHDNNTDDANNGSTPFSQAPMFTADQLQVMHQQFQQRSNNPNVTDTQFMQQQQQQQYSASTNDTTNHNWMQLVQPTPLGSHLQNQQYANQQQSSSREVQLMLQQLFQDQQNQDNNMTGHSSASTSLFTIGSTVEPMHHRSHADSNQDEPDFFKDMWDVDDIALPGKPPSSYKASKATTKRKWMNGDATNYTNLLGPQRSPYEHLQNQQNFGRVPSHPGQSIQNDAMDDSDDFHPTTTKSQYGNRSTRDESPMSTSSGVGVPPNQEILPASCISSSRDVLQQQIFQSEDSNMVSISEEDFAFLLPSTLLPPSVMASVLPRGLPTGPNMTHKGPSASAGGGRYKKKKGTKSTRVESPLDALQRILSLQGYGPITRIPAESAQYETVPSPLQLASFGTELVKAIHASDTHQLSKLLETGLSPNPCNKFRDSMVDLVCKRANGEVFKCLVNHGCDLRVCDGFGRTPLHHCCWANEFSADIAETILTIDWLQLFIEDKRGQIPLEYIRPDQAADWVEFLEDNRQRFFPIGGKIPAVYPVKDFRPDNVLPDPMNALPIELASAISSGRLTPDELANMDPISRAKFR